MRKLTPADYTSTRWRNGRGETAMIATDSRTDAAGNPLWRLSLAAVTEDGPFSLFPEYTRILTVVSGAGLRLTARDGFDETLRTGESLRFPGALEVSCSLLDGPVEDLNLMFTAAVASASSTTCRLERPVRVSHRSGERLFLFGVAGAVRVSGGAAAELGKGHTLCLEPADPGGDLELTRRGSEPAVVVLVRL